MSAETDALRVRLGKADDLGDAEDNVTREVIMIEAVLLLIERIDVMIEALEA